MYPSNLDLSLFGKDAEKVAWIMDRIYRGGEYADSNGFLCHNLHYPVSVSMERLREYSGVSNPARIMDLICRSDRHQQYGTQPIEEVIERVSYSNHALNLCAKYRFVQKYRTKPNLLELKRTTAARFRRRSKKQTEEMIAKMPESYQTVCKHIKKLCLAMSKEQLQELLRTDREEYLRNDPELAKLTDERDRNRRIAELDDEHYNARLFIRDKFEEAQGERELPIYSCDKQGRLHYYITNMTGKLRSFIRLNGCKVVSYDLGTSQCVFIWIALREYIQREGITLTGIKTQADEIIQTIKQCGDGVVPDYVTKGFGVLKRKRSEQALSDEMRKLGKLLGKDFYEDIMKTIDWKRLPDGSFDRGKFKQEVLFSFLYGKNLTWKENDMMKYFISKFPAVYCMLWKMRGLTNVCLDYYEMLRNGVHHKEAIERVAENHQTAEFPKEMQRQEANMFYNVIIPQIHQPLVTIHDSIIVEGGKRCNVKKIIEQSFMEKHQIKVRVKHEPW